MVRNSGTTSIASTGNRSDLDVAVDGATLSGGGTLTLMGFNAKMVLEIGGSIPGTTRARLSVSRVLAVDGLGLRDGLLATFRIDDGDLGLRP